MTCHSFVIRWSLILPLGVASWSAQSQDRLLLDMPGTFNLRLREVYLQADLDVDHEVQEAGTPSVSVTRQRIIFQPVVGLGLSGWAYHPNLLDFSCLTELGLDYQDAREDPGNWETDSHFLQRYHVSMDFLKQKPYATTLFADKDLTYRDYDFFSRVRVDSERFGVRSGYTAGAVPFYVSFQHYDEIVEDLTRPTRLSEDTLSFNSSNQRRSGKGSTQLNYNLSQFLRIDDGFSNQRGLNQNLSLFDSENYGVGDWIHLASLLNCNSVTETVEPSAKLLLQEQLQLQHTRRWRSFYEYEFDISSAGNSDANTHQGRIGLTHQLFENLTSTVDVHGNRTHATSPGSVSDTSRYGVALNEQYTRSLGNWGDFSLGYAGSVNREEREASGDLFEILDEVHTLTDGTLTFLNQPFVVESTVHVTDRTGTIIYQRDLDYLLINQGSLTEIRRVPGGTIPNGGAVLVDYAAVLEPSGKYTSFDNTLNFRLDFWKGLLGIYGRWTTLDYSGGEQLNLRWLDDRTVGVDTAWRWLRAGAEYQVVDSNMSPYERWRLFQSAQFRLSQYATLGLDLDQSRTTFRDNGDQQETYGLIARYQQRLSPTLAWTTEGGVRIERGNSFDGNYASARTELDWAVGQLTVKLGYQYGNESHPTDLMERHYLYLRARRSF